MFKKPKKPKKPPVTVTFDRFVRTQSGETAFTKSEEDINHVFVTKTSRVARPDISYWTTAADVVASRQDPENKPRPPKGAVRVPAVTHNTPPPSSKADDVVDSSDKGDMGVRKRTNKRTRYRRNKRTRYRRNKRTRSRSKH